MNSYPITHEGNTYDSTFGAIPTPPAPVICEQCGKECKADGIASGYAVYRTAEGERKLCYECAAAIEQADMIEYGKAYLYLSLIQTKLPPYPNEKSSEFDNRPTYWSHKTYGGDTVRTVGAKVGNWTGHLNFKIKTMWRGNHNIAGVRYDVDFVGPDGHIWHGTTYGNNTQILHAKRTKRLA